MCNVNIKNKNLFLITLILFFSINLLACGGAIDADSSNNNDDDDESSSQSKSSDKDDNSSSSLYRTSKYITISDIDSNGDVVASIPFNLYAYDFDESDFADGKISIVVENEKIYNQVELDDEDFEYDYDNGDDFFEVKIENVDANDEISFYITYDTNVEYYYAWASETEKVYAQNPDDYLDIIKEIYPIYEAIYQVTMEGSLGAVSYTHLTLPTSPKV